MLNFRRETELKKGELCTLVDLDGDAPYSRAWRKQRPRVQDFKLFYILDTKFGGGDLMQLIPVCHKNDDNTFYWSDKAVGNPWKKIPLLAVRKDLRRCTLKEVMPYVNMNRVRARTDILNGNFNLNNTDMVIAL